MAGLTLDQLKHLALSQWKQQLPKFYRGLMVASDHGSFSLIDDHQNVSKSQG
jgi:hypothetical protein